MVVAEISERELGGTACEREYAKEPGVAGKISGATKSDWAAGGAVC